jgi:hypothetical protein
MSGPAGRARLHGAGQKIAAERPMTSVLGRAGTGGSNGCWIRFMDYGLKSLEKQLFAADSDRPNHLHRTNIRPLARNLHPP